MGPRPFGGEAVSRVAQRAIVDRQAATADASVEPVPEQGQTHYPSIEIASPVGRHCGPIRLTRRPVDGQGREPLRDFGEPDAKLLRDLDDGDPPKCGPLVATLIAA